MVWPRSRKMPDIVRRSTRSRNFTYNSLEENRLTAPYSLAEEEDNKRLMRSSHIMGYERMQTRRHSDNHDHLDPDENASPNASMYDSIKSRRRLSLRGSSHPSFKTMDSSLDKQFRPRSFKKRPSRLMLSEDEEDEEVAIVRKFREDNNRGLRAKNREKQRAESVTISLQRSLRSTRRVKIESGEEAMEEDEANTPDKDGANNGRAEDGLEDDEPVLNGRGRRGPRPARRTRNEINSVDGFESDEEKEDEHSKENSDEEDEEEEEDIKEEDQDEEETAGEELAGTSNNGRYSFRRIRTQTNRYVDNLGRGRRLQKARTLSARPCRESEEEDSAVMERPRPKRKCVEKVKSYAFRDQPVRLPRNIALEHRIPKSALGLSFSQRGKSTRRRSRFYDSSSTTSTTSSDNEGQPTTAINDLKQEAKFEHRKLKSMMKGRQHLMPMNMTDKDMNDVDLAIREKQRNAGSSCADIDPMTIDREVGFDHIGGLTTHIQALKEIIQLPMLYPELYKRFDVDPPKGVLFYGPPGTGKTLIARALANECSRGQKKVAFFMRKGADCLSKWVGESERQLRLLFDQAYKMRPAIIFFDEIDGLAPVRSSRQDQIHSSIVSTLLALMDGLDKREQIVIIGATNRLDAIDPALRRPGRFDREFRFDLPDVTARKSIISINTRKWGESQPSPELLNWLAENTPGYCGADLKSLCTESVLVAMRNLFPHMYLSKEKLLLDPSKLTIEKSHFSVAIKKIVPAARRDFSVNSQPIEDRTSCFVAYVIDNIISKVPDGYKKRQDVDNLWNSDLEKVVMALKAPPSVPSARLLIHGKGSIGQTTHFLPVVVNRLDHLPVFTLSCEKVFAGGISTPEESISQTIRNALRATSQGTPSILLIPDLHILEFTLQPSTWKMLVSSLTSFTGFTSILILASTQQYYPESSEDIRRLFRYQNTIEILHPDSTRRLEYFEKLLLNNALYETPSEFDPADYPEPPKFQLTPEDAITPHRVYTQSEYKEHKKLYEQMLRQLRIFLRDLLGRLIRDRRFNVFNNPVEKEDAEDYYDVIKSPMCLSSMMFKIDNNDYNTIEDFVKDIHLIRNNAIEYNPTNTEVGRNIRHAANALIDMTDALLDLEMDDDFPEKLEKERLKVEEARKCVMSLNFDGTSVQTSSKIVTDETSQNDLGKTSTSGGAEPNPANGKICAVTVPMLNGLTETSANEGTPIQKQNGDVQLLRKKKSKSRKRKASKTLSYSTPTSAKKKLNQIQSKEDLQNNESVEGKEELIEPTNSKTTEDASDEANTGESQNNEECGLDTESAAIPAASDDSDTARSSSNDPELEHSWFDAAEHTSTTENIAIPVLIPAHQKKSISGVTSESLKLLAEKAAEKTIGWSIPDLECLAAELDQCALKYRQKWNRNGLLIDLEICIERFQL